MRLARITASRGDCSASLDLPVKRSFLDAEPPGGTQQPHHAHAVLDATVHSRVDRFGERYAPRDHVGFGPVALMRLHGRRESASEEQMIVRVDRGTGKTVAQRLPECSVQAYFLGQLALGAVERLLLGLAVASRNLPRVALPR